MTKKKNASESTQAEERMMTGAEILVRALIHNGIDIIFAYPGGASIPLHQAMSRYRDQLRVVLPRHEQGGGFAAQGYARSTGKLGVCMTTSGPGATNLITSIDDAKLDSVPLLIITGQVGTGVIGSDGFQETPMTEVCRSITKHHYLLTDVNDVTRIVNEAILVATTGRPGPVLIDIPKDVQVGQCYPDFNAKPDLPGYDPLPPKVKADEVSSVAEAIRRARRPVIFAGGGVMMSGASAELLKLAEQTDIPVATSMPALAAFPRDHRLSIGMLGMHGTVYANCAVRESDLLLAIGTRFSDRVVGNVSQFAKGAHIIHVDIDPSEFGKVKKVHQAIFADAGLFLKALNKKLASYQHADLSPWHEKIAEWEKKYPVCFRDDADHVLVQYAISELSKATQDRETYIATGVGQHQLWTTLFYHFSRPRTWLSSCGLGTMGFGLPAAIGAKVAHPDALVVAIEGDGSLQMNIQEMATCITENIPVKLMVMNNQFLGNVMQWEDVFYKSNRGNTYLGRVTDPEATGGGDGISPKHRYPDYPMIARGYGWETASVTRRDEFAGALDAMLNSKGPFLLEVNSPYGEHVLPFIPGGCTVADVIYKNFNEEK